MQENETTGTRTEEPADQTVTEEDDAFLPDGWDGKSEDVSGVFAEDTQTGADMDAVETEPESPPEAGTAAETDGADGQSADGQSADGQSADGQPVEEQTTEERTPETPPGQTSARPEPSARQEAEQADQMALAELRRKAELYDKSLEDAAKAAYRDTYRRLTEQGGYDPAIARVAAMNAAGGKEYPMEDAPGETGAAVGQTANAALPVKDFRAELQELSAAYPDAKEMPAEVMRAYMDGAPLKEAYAAYALKAARDEAARLRTENERLKQNQDAAQRAPVRGVSGGGKAQEKPDPMLAAFDEDKWG